MSGSIFGATNTKQSSQSQSTGSQVQFQEDVNPYQPLRDPFATALGNQMQAGVGGFNPQQFGPVTQAGMTAGETGAMGNINSLVMDPARRALLQQTMQGNFLPGQSGANPYLQSAIESAQRPTMLALEQAIQRRIPGMFAQAGHNLGERGSSPYMRELGSAVDAGSRALGDIATNMSFQGYDAERQRQLQAVQFDQGEIQGAVANFNAQAFPRLIQQHGIDQGIAAGQQQLDAYLRQLQLMAQTFQPTPFSFGVGQQQATSSSTGTSTSNPGIFAPLKFAPIFG